MPDRSRPGGSGPAPAARPPPLPDRSSRRRRPEQGSALEMLEIGGKRGSTERSGQRLDAMGGNDARVDVGAAIVETVPNVRQTAIVTPKLSNNVNATRPTLVNDIVIISEAPESPTANRTIPISRSSASGNNMPSIWPVAGAIRGGFGVRHNPFGGPGSEFHKGQDISAAYGSQVIATADGVVVIAGWLRGYGNVVYVDHGNGISTRYGHLSHIDVTVGQTVKRGDNLGLVGSTGRSTGPHLHYEVRIDGQATNPIPYLPNVPEQPVTTSPANR